MLNQTGVKFSRAQFCFLDRLKAKHVHQLKALLGSKNTIYNVFLVAGATLLALESFAGDANISVTAEAGKLLLWVTLLAFAFYAARRGGQQKRNYFHVNCTHEKESSNGKKLDSSKDCRHMKVLASNNEHGEENGHCKGECISNGKTRCGGPAACQKQLQHPEAHADRRLARKKESIRLAVKAGDKQQAERLLEEMFDAGFVPDVRICNFVIKACAKKGDVACAETWFMKMRSMGLTPNKTSYNMILDACVKADNLEAVEKWFIRFIDDGQTPDEVSYATMIYAHAKHGATEQAEKWLQQSLNAGVQPNIVTYNSLIFACSRRGDIAGAEKWAYEAEKNDLSARVSNHTVLVDAFAESGDESPAGKMSSSKVEPNVVTYSAMIDACAKAGDRVRAERWHRRMLERGLQPNGYTFSSVIAACAKAGDVVAACQYLEDMEKAEIHADIVVYGSVLNACSKAGDVDRAKKIFQQMQSSGIRPNDFAFSLLAQSLGHVGNWVEVEKLQSLMITEGRSMNEHFLSALLLAYARNRTRQPQRAEAAFLDARAKGVPVNRHVLAALRRAVGAARCKELTSAQDVLPQQMPQSQQHQQPPAARAQHASMMQRGNQARSRRDNPSSTAFGYIKAGAR
jgi:pentatricopeptide repeat protein